MAWVKLDDQFPDHPKVVSAGPLAAWLYVCGLTYANRHLTDGFIPSGVLARLADVKGPQKLAATLVGVGLWELAEGGYQIHDYLAFQPSSEKVRQERESNAARQEAWRQRRNGVTNTAHNAITNEGVTGAPYPDPVRTQPQELATSQGTGGAGGDLVPDYAADAAASPPRPTRERRIKPAPKPSSCGPPLDPLFEAFSSAGLPRPAMLGREPVAAQGLLSHYSPEQIAACWQDHASGDYGNEVDHRNLSFGYLANNNRVGNWLTAKASPPRAGVNRNGSARASPQRSALQTLGADEAHLKRDWNAELGGG